MYQRLLLILTVLFLSGAAFAQDVISIDDGNYIYNAASPAGSLTNPTPVGANVMQKWVHDPSQKPGRIGSFQNDFKSYRWGSMSFRLRFPKNYTVGVKYPMIVFLHGAGEAASISNANNTNVIDRENQDQLYWGAEIFETDIEAGRWNGFLLFPQLLVNNQGAGATWDDNTIPPINGILDIMEQYNGLDPDRVITMGLSAGGFGSVNYARLFPKRIASVISSNPRFIQDVNAYIDNFVQVPIWMAAGGEDDFPDPTTVLNNRDLFAGKGGNMFMSYFPTGDHSSWSKQWIQNDIYGKNIRLQYWNAAHKAQPLVYYQNTEFCSGAPISVKMGLTPGFFAYEWQREISGVFTNIAGANTYTYTATQTGRYRARFKRTNTSNWSDYSPNPIVVTTKACTTDTAFVEHFEGPQINQYITFSAGPNGGNSPYFKGNVECQNGIFVNGTEVFSQDARGVQGGKFMLNNTSTQHTLNGQTVCGYFAGDQVWRTYFPANVTANTNYTLSFYIGNQRADPGTATNTVTQLIPKINNAALTPVGAQTIWVGNTSWKKYSFVWNSGGNTNAEIAITNNNTSGNGNDFVLDEISLVKSKIVPMPGGIDARLWAKADILPGTDSSIVALWSNSDVNGNNLQQSLINQVPVLRKDAANAINFNPVVTYNAATSKYNYVTNGFAGATVHNAAHVYVVAKFNNVNQVQTLFSERQGTNNFNVKSTASGAITFTAGLGANILTTANGVNEANKTTLWTFSKDASNATGDGNKQDIRKNGILVGSTGATTNFTGTNGDFRLGAPETGTNGQFNGSIAEIIYALDTTINTATENKIESYLALKYGTTLGNTTTARNYTAYNGTVYWTGDTTYQNDVFGIGTDSASGLAQAKSNSINTGTGDGTGQSAKGNLVLSTNTPLLNNRFLVIGNDGAPLTQSVIAPGAAIPLAVGSTRINREWKVVNTGGVGAVDISFDTTGLKNQAGGSAVFNYALMIDNDGNGNFNDGTISFYNATSASGKKINFSGAVLNNGVVFTILTLKNSALLPAIWLGFTAEAVNGNGVLNWKTSDEMNVDRYVVEHSFNGVSYSVTGSVTANNNSGENKYSFTDNGLAAGLHYYRIRRIDKDGKSEYSVVKTVKITTSGANVQVRPNPVVGATLVLAVNVQQSTKTTVQIMGVDGKVLLQQKVNLTAGSNFVNLDVANVPSGIYMVQVQLSDEFVTKKFIRQH
ncbi:MAG: T9SS type A sorting domain-containing protein [Chitinophagaceae bacterium]